MEAGLLPARDLGLYGAFKVTRFLIGKLRQFNEIANLRRGVGGKHREVVTISIVRKCY
jgi:hypothetical protein